MKKVIYNSIAVIWITLSMSCSSKMTPQWVDRLNAISLPVDMQGDSLIEVYFKYNQMINGYEVTARWRPFDKSSEVGPILINFRNPETRTEYNYFSPKYHSHDTDRISLAKDFKGHNDGDIYYFDYTSPDTIDQFKDLNDNSPIGYYTPFQFLDIDFNGEDELLISDNYQGQAGNTYEVYKLANDGLQKLDYMPLSQLTNMDRIDMEKKTITIVRFVGADDTAEFYFSHKVRKDRITNIPKFYSNSARDFDFVQYNKEYGAPFALDSIKEYGVKEIQEYHKKYIVRGSEISVVE